MTDQQTPGYSHPSQPRTLDEAKAAMIAAYRSGDKESAMRWLKEVKSIEVSQQNPYALQEAADAAALKTAEQSARLREMQRQNVADMGAVDRVRAGLGRSITNAGRGVGQLVGLVSKDDVAESRRLDAPLMESPDAFAANLAGDIGMSFAPGGALKLGGQMATNLGARGAGAAVSRAGSAMLVPSTLRQAGTLGATHGAMQPVVDDFERLFNAGVGGAAGAGGQAALKGLSRVVSPHTSKDVLTLLSQGVTPTPGQIAGGGFKRFEEALTSVGGLGDVIRLGQGRAVDELNAAALQRALTPVGEQLTARPGREAIQEVSEKLGAKYDQIMPKLTTVADGQFIQDLTKIHHMLRNSGLPPAEIQRFETIIQNKVSGRFMPGANGASTITGQTMKGIESDLGEQAAKFSAATDVDQRTIGGALLEVQDSLRSLVMRSNPQHAKELKSINEGWAIFKRLQKAAGGVGAEGGEFSPAQLQSAVRAMDKSKDKGAFARGGALLQDLSEAGKNVLSPKLRDSGTPARLMAAGGAGGLIVGGSALGAISPMTAIGLLAGPAMYSKPGQQLMATLLARRPAAAKPVGDALERLSRYGTAPAVGYSTSNQ